MSDLTTPDLDDLNEDDEFEDDAAGVQHKATPEEVDELEDTA